MSDNPQGNGAPEAPQGDVDSPNHVTTEQLNRAITARFRSFEKNLERQLSSQLETFAQQLQAPSGETQEASNVESKGDVEQLAAMKRKLADVTRRFEDSQRLVEQERSARQAAKLRQTVSSALTEAGVDGSRLRHALGYLVDSAARVRHDEDGEIVFRDDDGLDVPLKEGLSVWAKTDDAKLYMPPRHVSGSGDRPRNSARRGDTPGDKRAELGNLLQRAMLGGSD
tara:strand:+ start:3260 stop:3937 length:678 start_codon:yes stop_codon:yes gene_type:complete